MKLFSFSKKKKEQLLTWHTGAKFIWEFRYQIIIDPILHGAQDNHWSSIGNYERKRKMQVRTKSCRPLPNLPARVILEVKLPNTNAHSVIFIRQPRTEKLKLGYWPGLISGIC